jgi:hypothetical protein
LLRVGGVKTKEKCRQQKQDCSIRRHFGALLEVMVLHRTQR